MGILIRALLGRMSVELMLVALSMRNGVPMLSAGISFNVIFPSAFVSLSSATLKALPPWPRIRIAAGGAWHNILFWALLWFASFSGITAGAGRAVGWLGWRYVGDIGRVVLSIAEVRVSLPANQCYILRLTY